MIRSKKLWFIAPLVLASVLQRGECSRGLERHRVNYCDRECRKDPAASTVWFAYSSLAMYDAVNAITGEYEPFYYHIAGPSNASIDAAAVAAAHRILVNYFPAQQTALDTQFTTSLAALWRDQDAKTAGVAVGEAAAMAVISARAGDGLEANVIYTPGSGPGAWIPTPPAFAAPATPWLGQMRPFTMKSASDQLPDPPRALTSETLEPGLQPDSKLWRHEQHGSIRGGNRDRDFLDGTHRPAICPRIQQPGYATTIWEPPMRPVWWQCFGPALRTRPSGVSTESTSTASGGRSQRSRPAAETPIRPPTRPGTRWERLPTIPNIRRHTVA